MALVVCSVQADSARRMPGRRSSKRYGNNPGSGYAASSTSDKALQVELWTSPAKRIQAGRLPGSSLFCEMDQYKMQRFDRKENTIYVTEPQPFDMDEFVALDSILEAFASGQELKQSQAHAVRLIGQSKTKGGSGSDRWIDYVLDYEDARRNPPGFRRVFRVPEGSELPTSMTDELKWEGKAIVRTYTLDYPGDWPGRHFCARRSPGCESRRRPFRRRTEIAPDGLYQAPEGRVRPLHGDCPDKPAGGGLEAA